MVVGRPALAALVLFGGLVLSAILLSADLRFLGVMIGAVAVPAAVTVLITGEGEKYY